ncbi:MAG: hypothetical protein H0Z40_00485 [Desulfotomaculum sp.]|nr:hypothetical protein [Desulfotomaculum sp.]
MDILLFILFGYAVYKFAALRKENQKLKLAAENLQKQNKIMRGKTEDLHKDLFKKQLMSSAVTGAAGGLAAMLLINQIQKHNDLDQETVESMQNMDLDEIRQFAVENNLADQQEIDNLINQMQDPYQNPGMDIIVDEYYHGLDRGLGYVNPEHLDNHDFDSDYDVNNDFGMDHDFDLNNDLSSLDNSLDNSFGGFNDGMSNF